MKPEYKRKYIPYGVDVKPDAGKGSILFPAVPIDNTETTAADKEIISFLKDGWEIISTVPLSASFTHIREGQVVFGVYTCGIEVFLIRKT